ncbi:hypothetical protein [Geomicrobium sp. JCM 19038]|uniref:hypothetical protein n=1 Tax=Geomicrobium sp. JCM 19038 TaxID=1460635 RepID=UPI0005A685AE|nr:hypothetical protein [Geomicrobium sp. JCM 19038]
MDKQIYYVNLNPISMDDVTTTKIDDSELIQFEIEASADEIKELKTLLSEVQAHDMELQDLFTFRHFNEEYTDDDSREFQHGLDHVYKRIYELGTHKTREDMESMRPTLMSNEDESPSK